MGPKFVSIGGEFFQEFNPAVAGEELTEDNIEQFRVDSVSELGKNSTYLELLASSDEGVGRDDLLKIVSGYEKFYVLPGGMNFEVVEDINLKDAVLFVGKGSKVVSWPLVEIFADSLVAIGLKENPIVFTKKEGLTGWYGMRVANNGYLKNVQIDSAVNIDKGALVGEDAEYIKMENVLFSNNANNLHCSNSIVDVKDSIFINGIYAINASNSKINVDNSSCNESIYCFRVFDSNAKISKIKANNIKQWVFQIEGAYSDVSISDTEMVKSRILLYKKGGPIISMKEGGVIGDGEYGIIDLDDNDIHAPVMNYSKEDFFEDNKKLVVEIDEGTVSFKGKNPVIKEDFIIPKQLTLKIDPGTNIKLEKNTSILAYGKIISIGNNDDKITFSSNDEKGRSWGVVLLKGDASYGEFENTVFDNGGDDYLVGKKYSGALTVDSLSELVVRKSVFRNSKGDDALNCKYSKCIIEGNLFEKNSMDGVDFDFADNSSIIKENEFRGNGNDAIDASSDNSSIYKNKIINSGDKGISIGEKSFSIVFDNYFENCDIGIEAKDGSAPVVVNNTFIGNKIALNAYWKKRRFSHGGVVAAYNSVFEGNEKVSSSDKDSNVEVLDGFSKDLYEEYLGKFNLNDVINGISE
ncbi:right-handed parallel beta-helix repeat-containing protein [Patescibacteria group bacterium]